MCTYCKYYRYIPIAMNKLAVMSCCMNVPYIYVFVLYATTNNITQIFLRKYNIIQVYMRAFDLLKM